ncbi:MAG: phosphonate C-P lyase system protein PhnG [Acetobacteraceae bacterium]
MSDPAQQPQTPRQQWMAVLARASADQLATASAGLLPQYTTLRGPETGLVMVQGRTGGAGGAFNLGEASVVRCTVRSEAGQVGHAYCLGRDLRQAELAAALDAGLQDPATGAAIQAQVVEPLAQAQAAAREQTARRAAATQVQFFTMATMRT